MKVATIDCGTTNSRVYILDRKGEIIGKASKKVGVKDTALNGKKRVLKEGLKETFLVALKNAGMQLDDIAFAICSGMITSEIGLIEIPHLWAPVKLEELSRSMEKVHDIEIFPIDIPVYFIRGIKNTYDSRTANMKHVGYLDFMRGEETQLAGLAAYGKLETDTTVVILSSHTKFISVGTGQTVLGSITTMSGQLHEAIIEHTFVGKSVQGEASTESQGYFDPYVIETAYFWVMKSGFIRSLMFPRFLDTLLQTEWYERELFVDALIAAEDMRSLDSFRELKYPLNTPFIIIGKKRRCEIYRYLLKAKLKTDKNIELLTEDSDIEQLSIKGALHLAEFAGLFERKV